MDASAWVLSQYANNNNAEKNAVENLLVASVQYINIYQKQAHGFKIMKKWQ